MKLYFENMYGEKRLLKESGNAQELKMVVRQFLDDHKFKSYYWRYNWDNKQIVLDVGSHSEFFYFTDFNDVELKQVVGGYEQ